MWCENFHRYIRLPRHCSVPIAYILSVYGLVVVRFVDGIPKKNIQHGLRLPLLKRLTACKPSRGSGKMDARSRVWEPGASMMRESDRVLGSHAQQMHQACSGVLTSSIP